MIPGYDSITVGGDVSPLDTCKQYCDASDDCWGIIHTEETNVCAEYYEAKSIDDCETPINQSTKVYPKCAYSADGPRDTTGCELPSSAPNGYNYAYHTSLSRCTVSDCKRFDAIILGVTCADGYELDVGIFPLGCSSSNLVTELTGCVPIENDGTFFCSQKCLLCNDIRITK